MEGREGGERRRGREGGGERGGGGGGKRINKLRGERTPGLCVGED